MDYKEEKAKIEREYRQKLSDLEKEFKKYASFKENDIVLYNAHKYDYVNKYDEGHTLAIGVIGGLELDNNEIRYIMKFANTYNSDYNPELEIVAGLTTSTVPEKNIIMRLGETKMKLTEFLKSFIKYEKQ